MTETLSSAFTEVHKIVEGLGGKMTTPSKGRCKCPAHDDHDPSLDVEVKNGKPVWKCHSKGCSQEAVLKELIAKGLWHSTKSTSQVNNEVSDTSDTPDETNAFGMQAH